MTANQLAQTADGVWGDVVGQERVVDVLRSAVRSVTAAAPGQASGMTHAWLFTGPPGSGRSVAARAFAAALQCPKGGCGQCHECRTALGGSHADVSVVATELLSIKTEQARELVQLAARRPTLGRWRVIIIEDADRLTETAADVLLKAIEEPPPGTVWMLCAPSLEDVIVTIRSRCRHLGLRTPSVAAVADLLVRRDGIDPPMAAFAARAAQSHIGLARRLARDEGARIRRRDVVTLPFRIRGVGDAVLHAGELVETAAEEAKSATAERDAGEREQLVHSLGAEPTARTQPPHVRAQLSALERDQKTRATRLQRDVLDRALVDVLSVYRDVLVVQAGDPVDLVNEEMRTDLAKLARDLAPEHVVQRMQAVGEARERIAANVAPLLAVEAMTVQLRASQ
ncbi:MAG: DNA polymerase III subunit delta' [Actinomycetales bacterium]